MICLCVLWMRQQVANLHTFSIVCQCACVGAWALVLIHFCADITEPRRLTARVRSGQTLSCHGLSRLIAPAFILVLRCWPRFKTRRVLVTKSRSAATSARLDTVKERLWIFTWGNSDFFLENPRKNLKKLGSSEGFFYNLLFPAYKLHGYS